MTNPKFSRRQALIAGAALPFAPALLSTPVRAAAPLQGASMPLFNRFALGGLEVTTLLSATRTVETPNEIFGLNATPEEFASVSAAAFLPTNKAQFFFTPTLVNTGTALVLFDTGSGAEGITTALAAAGVTPDQIDLVVITHMHPDHIGGLMSGDAPTFANARYAAGAVENTFWARAANEAYDKMVRPLLEKVTLFDDGATVVPGVTAMAAYGHTPGHMTFMLESDGAGLLLAVDTANHFVWSLAHPDWEVRFDADKAAAAATRRTVFGMLAADKLPFIGYHMPFPAVGYVEANDSGFRYVPASYQMMMNG